MRFKIGNHVQDSHKALVLSSGAPPYNHPVEIFHVHHCFLASELLVDPPASQAPDVVLSSWEHHLSTSATQIASPCSIQGNKGDAVGVMLAGQLSSRLFTTSSGERVLFRQVGGYWQAELQNSTGTMMHHCLLPVVSCGDIEMLLSVLQHQDVWASRSSIHVMPMAHPPYMHCVFLGKIGLFGGSPTQQVQSSSKEEWLPAHTMILANSETRTDIYHIQPHYRYKAYRLMESSVIQHASLTIRYVEANNEEDFHMLQHFKDGRKLLAKLQSHFDRVIPLGMLDGGVEYSSTKICEDLHVQRSKHAGLVLFGKTKQDILCCKKSKIDVRLEICVERIQPTSTNPPVDENEPTRQQQQQPSPQPAPPPMKPMPCIELEKARSLLKKKLDDPTYSLNESQSISLLTLCVSDGAENAKCIAGKEAVIVLGNTGAGKSTFVNYLLGCDMILKTPGELEKLGIAVFHDTVVVNSSKGGQCDEVMPIGHCKTSKTFMPQIAVDPSRPNLAYCDCPGFFDNRGVEINIANAENIKHILQEAKCVKVVILINYNSLDADRGRGLTDMLNICTQLFGSVANLEQCKDSLLIGVTKAPGNLQVNFFRKWLNKDTPTVIQVLSKRLFFYDPVNRGGKEFWDREKCVSEIAALNGILQSQSCNMFQTVLTADDVQKFLEIMETQGKTIEKELYCGADDKAGSCWQALQRLGVIKNIFVEQTLNSIQQRVMLVIANRVNLFKDHLLYEKFDEAQKLLDVLFAMTRHFCLANLELDFKKLQGDLEFYKSKQSTVKYNPEEQEQCAGGTEENALETTTKQKIELQQSMSLLEYKQVISKLMRDKEHYKEIYDKDIAKLQQVMKEAITKQEEMLILNKAICVEEQEKLQAVKVQQQCIFEKKLATEKEKYELLCHEYNALMAHEEVRNKEMKLKLQEQIDQIIGQSKIIKAELAEKTNSIDDQVNDVMSLYVASQKGDLESVKLLLKKGATIECSDEDGFTPLSIACQEGYLQIVDLLLKKGAQIECQNKYNWTPLCIASYNGNSNIAELLLGRNADIEHKDGDGRTPLYIACQNDSYAVVKLLLEKGANIDHQDNDGYTSLYIGSQKGYVRIVALLLKESANTECKDKNGMTPLCISVGNVAKLLLLNNANVKHTDIKQRTSLWLASWRGDLKSVKLLLKKGANIECSDEDGFTPLSIACQEGYLQIVDLLLKKGAQTECQSKYKWTPLCIASYNGNSNIAKLLLGKKAHIEHQDEDGCTPLYIASQYNSYAVVKLLLEKGANIDHQDKDGYTSLCIASHNNYVKVVALLLKEKANIEHCDKNGLTPLSIASENGCNDVVELLLKEKVTIDHQNAYHWTPLCLASHNGHVEIVRQLLQKGANIEHQDEKNWTPLYIASFHNHHNVITLLLEKNAKIDHQDKYRWTPLCIASEKGHVETVKLLLEKGANINHQVTLGYTALSIAKQNKQLQIVNLLISKGKN